MKMKLKTVKSGSAAGIFVFTVTFLAVAFGMAYFSGSFNARQAANIKKEADAEYVIVIDAGHGGEDGGAVGQGGFAEKDINLEISKRLAELLELSDVKCVMTRNSDVMLESKKTALSNKKRSDLTARVETALEYENPIFVSIHQNKFPSSKYSGLQVFYSKNNVQSKTLAEIIRKNNVLLLDKFNKRETKPAGREIFVLDSLEVPAVLVECGFLSNATEEAKLTTPEYQKKLAFMIYVSVMEFLENTDKQIIYK